MLKLIFKPKPQNNSKRNKIKPSERPSFEIKSKTKPTETMPNIKCPYQVEPKYLNQTYPSHDYSNMPKPN